MRLGQFLLEIFGEPLGIFLLPWQCWRRKLLEEARKIVEIQDWVPNVCLEGMLLLVVTIATWRIAINNNNVTTGRAIHLHNNVNTGGIYQQILIDILTSLILGLIAGVMKTTAALWRLLFRWQSQLSMYWTTQAWLKLFSIECYWLKQHNAWLFRRFPAWFPRGHGDDSRQSIDPHLALRSVNGIKNYSEFIPNISVVSLPELWKYHLRALRLSLVVLMRHFASSTFPWFLPL